MKLEIYFNIIKYNMNLKDFLNQNIHKAEKENIIRSLEFDNLSASSLNFSQKEARSLIYMDFRLFLYDSSIFFFRKFITT